MAGPFERKTGYIQMEPATGKAASIRRGPPSWLAKSVWGTEVDSNLSFSGGKWDDIQRAVPTSPTHFFFVAEKTKKSSELTTTTSPLRLSRIGSTLTWKRVT